MQSGLQDTIAVNHHAPETGWCSGTGDEAGVHIDPEMSVSTTRCLIIRNGQAVIYTVFAVRWCTRSNYKPVTVAKGSVSAVCQCSGSGGGLRTRHALENWNLQYTFCS